MGPTAQVRAVSNTAYSVEEMVTVNIKDVRFVVGRLNFDYVFFWLWRDLQLQLWKRINL